MFVLQFCIFGKNISGLEFIFVLTLKHNMMARSSEELTLDVSWDIIDCSAGIALDIGGSVVKFVYLHKDDWVQPKKRTRGSKGRLHAVSFAREQVKEALKQIQPNVHILRKSTDDLPHVYSTGFGGAQFNDSIRETFQVSNNILSEFDCFVHAFFYMVKMMPCKQILHELHKPAFEKAKKIYDSHSEVVAKMKSTTDIQLADTGGSYSFPLQRDELTEKTISEKRNTFPLMLVILGSGFACMVVNEDGTFFTSDGATRGGRMFLGLGSLLTEATTYDDLLALCENGKSNKVNSTNKTLLKDLGKGEDKDKVYQLWEDAEEEVAFCFGQAVGKQIGNFQKEDLARCLLETTVMDMVQVAQNAAWRNKVRHLFFCGSFTNHPLARASILTEWLRKSIEAYLYMNINEQCQVHFLKHGAYLGAFGAFLNSKLKFGGTQPVP